PSDTSAQGELTHFFVVIRSKLDGSSYKIDPWREGLQAYTGWVPRDMKSGAAAELVPFTGGKRYEPNQMGRDLPPPNSLWQHIDDFLFPPAYGDEVLPGGQIDYGGSGLLDGVLFSTTGPGKRGGRGGGITRPPGWPNPPGPQ